MGGRYCNRDPDPGNGFGDTEAKTDSPRPISYADNRPLAAEMLQARCN